MSETLLERIFALPPGLYHWPARVSRVRLDQRARQKHWQVAMLDGRSVATKQDFLARCADVLNFPPYFGYNWDAFEECLAGMPAEPGFLLLLSNLRTFAQHAPADWDMARTILGAAAERWGARGVPFVVLVRGLRASRAPTRPTGTNV